MKRTPLRRTGRLRRQSKRNSQPHVDTALRRAYLDGIADGLCELCRRAPFDDPHHICAGNPKVDSVSNLLALCRPCHDLMHAFPIQGKLLCWGVKAAKRELDFSEASKALRMRVEGWLDQDKVRQALSLPRDLADEVLRRVLLRLAEQDGA